MLSLTAQVWRVDVSGCEGVMIDWDRVRNLKAEIGEPDFAEVATMFLDESDEVIARLSCDHGALTLEKDLHFLKGAALNLGFAQLASLCQDGERRAAAGLTDIDLASVRSAYLVTRQTFLAECGPMAASTLAV